MQARILQVLTSAYRATLEEQDDAVLFLTHALRNNGADIDVLLRGTAVSYAVRRQCASGLAFGEWQQTQPPDIAYEVHALMARDAAVYVLADDAAIRGIRRDELLEGVRLVARAELPALLHGYERIWQW